MPFSIQLHLGTDEPVIFVGWLEEAFGKFVPKGTPFAKARGAQGDGFIVANGPMVLSTKAPLTSGCALVAGECIAAGAANGEDIPYGKPYCVFVLDRKP